MRRWFLRSLQVRLVWGAVILGGCFFFATSFRKGWTRVETGKITGLPEPRSRSVLFRYSQLAGVNVSCNRKFLGVSISKMIAELRTEHQGISEAIKSIVQSAEP